MKLGLPTFKKDKTLRPKKKFRVDARRYWVFMLCAFVLLLAGELVFFSLSFLRVTAQIEAPANPALETNDTKIRHMQQKLDAVEKAINARTGTAASQNNSPMVQ